MGYICYKSGESPHPVTWNKYCKMHQQKQAAVTTKSKYETHKYLAAEEQKVIIEGHMK